MYFSQFTWFPDPKVGVNMSGEELDPSRDPWPHFYHQCWWEKECHVGQPELEFYLSLSYDVIVLCFDWFNLEQWPTNCNEAWKQSWQDNRNGIETSYIHSSAKLFTRPFLPHTVKVWELWLVYSVYCTCSIGLEVASFGTWGIVIGHNYSAIKKGNFIEITTVVRYSRPID